jgi:hypothetical protein
MGAAATDLGKAQVGRDMPGVMLDVRRIYLEPAAEQHPRGQEILARFPDAERMPVRSHWHIPELHGDADLADHWNSVKRTTLVLGGLWPNLGDGDVRKAAYRGG